MKHALLTAALMLTALEARAEVPPMLDVDPLASQIMHLTAQPNGGVTGAVGVPGSPVGIMLEFADVAAPFVAHMAPAASPSKLGLKPAPGLKPKVSKTKPKKAPRRAGEQLKHISKAKNWGDKP